jgi:hypothetical protein
MEVSGQRPSRFTPGETITVQLDRSPGGLAGEDKCLLPLPGIEFGFLGHLSRSLVTIPTDQK